MYYPIISVIMIPTAKGPFLYDAIESVMKQSYPHWELILVCAGSDLLLHSNIKRYALKDSRIKTIMLSDSANQDYLSASSLYTLGIKKAKGEWICFLSEDDMYTQDRFATLIEHSFSKPNIEMFHTSYIIRDDIHSTISGVSFPEDLTITKLFSPLSFMRSNTILLSSIFIHRNTIPSLPVIPKNIKYAYLFSVIMSMTRTTKSGFIHSITAHHRIHAQNITAINEKERLPSQKQHITTSIAPYDIQFDMGTMCVIMLHHYSLQELCPFLVSDDVTLYQSFISTILSTALSPSSLVYACGVHTLLLERLLEWLTNDAPALFKNDLHEYTSNLILAQFSSIPLSLQEICSKIIHKVNSSYSFVAEPLSIILARSGAEILRSNPSTAMLYMSYCQKTVPDIYSNMLIYFHDAPVQNNSVLHRAVPVPLDTATQANTFQASQNVRQ